MNILSQVIKTPSIQSKFRQYLCITLGPFLILGAFIAFLCKWSIGYSMLSLLVVASLPLIWKYQIKGALFSIFIVLATFFGMSFFLDATMNFSWLLVWCLSLCVSLSLAGMSSKYFHEVEAKEKEEEERRNHELKEGYESKERKLKTDLLHIEDEKQTLEENVARFKTKINSFQDLVVASKEESDKYFMQAEELSKRLVEMQKETAIIERQKISLEHLTLKNKELQKKLNEDRVNLYQKELLFNNFLKKGNGVSKQVHEEEFLSDEIENLRSEREQLLDLYENAFRDYQALKDKLQNYFTMDRLSSFPEDDVYQSMYRDLKSTFTAKARELQAMRSDIFKIEGQLVEIKASSSSVNRSSISDYLLIADRECLRLEEENALFLDLFMSSLSALEEKREAMILSESHNRLE